ncbi:MAG TPA: hypothetical protein VJS67_06280 [Pseudonocardiaceae bacterium]|nr:hypothetical protein [Pseudonocardiaceae bacterium]
MGSSRADQPGANSEQNCQQCRKLAAELALNVLPARERVEALAHLDRCADCQEVVHALTVTADRLVALLPDAEPPVDFDQRAMTDWRDHHDARDGAG